MISPISLLAQRVDLLDRTYIGEPNDRKGTTNTDGALVERVAALNNKVDSIGMEIPALKTIYEQAFKLKPLIQQKKSSAVIISQRIDQILTQKEHLEKNFKQLTLIGDQAQYINSETFKNAEELSERLDSLNNTLQPLLVLSKEQSQEIDDLLNLYEQTMTVLSDVCSSWEEALREGNTH